jgi:hypothetical protein
MIAYDDCEYSLFISYVHDDDIAQFGWVRSLHDAIFNRLSNLDKKITKRGLYLSELNGLGDERLNAELRERLAKSFGMLLVIGKEYVSSGYCEDELKFFIENFGVAGMESRLYIVVISEDALIEAKKGEQWKKLMPSDQIWVPMFEKNEHNKPLLPTMNDGTSGYPALFVNQVTKIADRLIKEIETDHAQSKKC